MLKGVCPSCGAHLDIAAAVNDADGRRFVELMRQVPGPLVRPLLGYLYLFRPPKTALRWSRMVSLTQELLPMIQSARIEHGHARYVAPVAVWAEHMTALADNPPASLRLPLKSHGYLLSIMAGACEKAAARAEQRDIERKRNAGAAAAGGDEPSRADHRAGLQSIKEVLRGS